MKNKEEFDLNLGTQKTMECAKFHPWDEVITKNKWELLKLEKENQSKESKGVAKTISHPWHAYLIPGIKFGAFDIFILFGSQIQTKFFFVLH